MSEDIQAPEVAEAPSQAPVESQSFDNSPSSQASAPAGSVYDAFKQLPEFNGADDYTIANTLYQSMQGYREAQGQLRQYQQYMPKTMEYMRNEEQFRQWQAAQQQAAQPQQAPKPKWWSPPEVKDTWRQYIIRDPETGRDVIAPNAPLEAQAAIREYQDYTANFAKKFVTDPENTLKPFIEEIAQQKAEELVQRQLGQYTANNYVQSLEQQNSDWLYDQSGQVSREGQAIQAYIAQAAERGISSPQARWEYATSMLERDLLNLRYQQMQQAPPQGMPPPAAPPAPDPTTQQNMQFLRERATRAPSRSGGAAEPRVPKPGQSFQERFKAQLVKDGSL
jgi:hypothetical protein